MQSNRCIITLPFYGGVMPKISKMCVVCGDVFAVWPNRAATAITCSQPCRGKVIAQRYEDARAKKTCPICRTEFSVPQSHDKRSVCCSVPCANTWFSQRNHKTGEDSPNWKGGKTRHTDGYIYSTAPDHPFASSEGRYVFEHRLIMEGRMRRLAPMHPFMTTVNGVAYLSQEIVVHHINEVKSDNRGFNLLACTRAAHLAIHRGRKPNAGEAWPE